MPAKVFFLGVVFVSLVLASSVSAMSSGCSHDCKKCHAITVDEVKRLVSQQQGDIKVLSVRMSPIKGLWEVIGEQNFKKGILYIDFEKKHIIYGAITNARGAANLTQQSLEHSVRIKKSDVDLTGSLYLGAKDAKVKIILFADPTCSHCAKLHRTIEVLVKKRRDIAFNIVLYPLKQYNPRAYEKAKSVFCMGSLKALEAAYEGKMLAPPNCKAAVLDHNLAIGQKYGITGTPTVVFPNGTMHFGLVTEKELLRLIERNI